MKFTANELLDSFNREFNPSEMYELYMALIAYNLGLKEITQNQYLDLQNVINYYIESDYISGIVNQDVMDYATQTVEGVE